MITNIPTDRNGNVYYGPKTFAAGREQVNYLVAQDEGSPQEVAEKVASMMEEGGYQWASEKLRNLYEVQ